MSTFPIHAPAESKALAWAHDTLVRIKWYARNFMEAYAEAQQMAREADKRYPFTYWS
jgi:hypothetical protein